jgi:hypothetical protein
MENELNTAALRIVHEDKLKELKAQQENLKKLEAELKRINNKIQKHEPLTTEDTKFIGNLGWLTALSVAIAALAALI